jgi:hypothetical protein
VLEISGTQRCHRLHDFQPAEVGRVAHRRSPVSAPDGEMQQLGAHFNQPHSGVPIVRADCRFQCVRGRIGGDPLLQFGTVSETILSGDDELSVTEAKGLRS